MLFYNEWSLLPITLFYFLILTFFVQQQYSHYTWLATIILFLQIISSLHYLLFAFGPYLTCYFCPRILAVLSYHTLRLVTESKGCTCKLSWLFEMPNTQNFIQRSKIWSLCSQLLHKLMQFSNEGKSIWKCWCCETRTCN